MLRIEPNNKISIEKNLKHAKKLGDYFPNKDILDGKEGLHFDNDVNDKDYYYKRLSKRLAYSRVYKMDGGTMV